VTVETRRRAGPIIRRRIRVDAATHLDVVDIGDHHAGPTVALIGGVHGDEDEGILSVRRVVAELAGTAVNGLVRAVAVANPPAYVARSRSSPVDGLNLARVFPGDAAGSLTQRLARAITDEIIAGADLLVDLHSAGRDFAMPLFCGYHHVGTVASQIAAQAASRFGIELLWAHTTVSEGRTLSAAAELGVPAIYAEASGGGEVRGAQTDAYVHGVLRLLRWLGVIDGPVDDVGARCVVRGGREDEQGSLEAATAGTMVTRVRAGQIVEPGCTVAEIYSEDGRCIDAVTSAVRATIMKLRRFARVTVGDQIAVLAPPPVPWPQGEAAGAAGAAG
jgi:predicted deacylase